MFEGFVALALEGSYTVLAVVDQTHLPVKVKDHVTKQVLGSTFEVKMKSNIAGERATEYVVATLYEYRFCLSHYNRTDMITALIFLPTIVPFSNVGMTCTY